MEEITKKSQEINKKLKKYVIVDYLMFFFSAAAIAGIIVTLKNGHYETLFLLSWVLCLLWMFITRAYKGIVDVYKENNEELTKLLVKVLEEKQSNNFK